jgi:RimJ/RimL family protein N-acetyltransferase
MDQLTGPAYRIETNRLVIRCYNPADATLLHAAVEASRDHLKPWMPWAHEDQTLQDHVELLRTFRGQFDLGEDFIYGIFSADETRLIGGSGLHTRQGSHIREIGYWVRVEDIHQGYARETAAALAKVAFELDRVQRVEIRCDPDNTASAAIPARLGFTREGNLRAQSGFLDQPRDTEVWSLLAGEYPACPAAQAEIRAFDVLGRLLLG